MADFTAKLRPAEPRGPDTLAKERAQSSLPVKELANHLLSSEYLERQERVLEQLEKEKLLCKGTQQNLSRPDRYKLGLARAKLLRRMSDRLGWSFEDYRMAEYLVDDVSPYMLHMSMFVTTIREQASEEQKAYWLPKIESWKIIGAYAQTELGHGSNVRGIELQAKWDPKTKEFILHSPSLTASKWWNGTLGRTANHAIVVAQLLLPTKSSTATTEKGYTSYGPHPFIVQVRDLKTHQPLPGIAVGDIGPKYGYASMDNAYMLFDNFHIPHAAFLSRYASVDPLSGAYSKPPNPAVVYGSLTYVRANIVMHARLVLARAVTIAIRYLSIRHQFPSRDAPRGPEVTTLDYPTVQTRILPLLATTFALHYSGTAMARQYARTRAGISGGDFGALADLHGTSSGLKSLCTTLAGDGVETCRRALGGHGYGGGSGLVQLNADYLSKPTVEGDNWMITQQTAAWLIKKVERARAAGGEREGPAADATEGHIRGFLRASRFGDRGNKFDVLHSDKAVVEAFRFRAAWMAVRAHEERVVKGRSWNSLLIQLHALSNAHSQSVLVENFYAALHDPPLGAAKSAAGEDERPVPEGARPVLKKLFRLFALSTLLSSPGAALEFQSSGCISLSQLSALPSAIQSLMAEIRPHAVALVDAWSLPEYLLDSALGRYDGRVYEDLFERASNIERNPLNAETFNPRYWEGEIVLGSGRGWDGRLLEEEGMVSKGRGLRGKL